MKPRDVLACFFAGYGVFLTFTSLLGAVGAAAAFLTIFRESHVAYSGIGLAQYAFAMLPLFIGLLLATLAAKLGSITARLAGLADDTSWNLQLTQRELLSVLLAVLGVYLIVTQTPEILRVAVLMFLLKGAGPSVAEMAARRFPDISEIIVHLLCAGGGVYIASKCSVIASKLCPGGKNGG